MKRIILSVVLILTCSFAFAADFGSLLDVKLEAENEMFVLTPAAAPWFSHSDGKGLQVYLSALLSFRYLNITENKEASGFTFIPELTVFSLRYKISPALSIAAGRMGYIDILNINANGLFDGVKFSADIGPGKLDIGAFYTGFLFKESALIVMNENDYNELISEWDFDNFGNYFASARVFASAVYNMPLTLFKAGNLCAELFAQFDLNDSNEKLNSQYFSLRLDMNPASMMRLSVGGMASMMQDDDSNSALAFGGLASIKTAIPTKANDWLGASVRFTTAGTDDAFSSFIPLVSTKQGKIFSNSIAGLAAIGIDYEARLAYAFHLESSFKYFIQTYDSGEGDGNLFGGELWANINWQPFEDLRATIGGGVFIPGLGNYYQDGEDDVQWKIAARVTMSF